MGRNMYLNNICTASFMTITAEKIAVGWADHFYQLLAILNTEGLGARGYD